MTGHVEVKDMDASALTAIFKNEQLHREGLIVAAGDPTLALMKQALAPHRRANPSAVDSIEIASSPSRAGYVEIQVGALGWRGFVLWFLNYGTRKQKPRPWVEPSRDKVKPGIADRLAAFLNGKAGAFKDR